MRHHLHLHQLIFMKNNGVYVQLIIYLSSKGIIWPAPLNRQKVNLGVLPMVKMRLATSLMGILIMAVSFTVFASEPLSDGWLDSPTLNPMVSAAEYCKVSTCDKVTNSKVKNYTSYDNDGEYLTDKTIGASGGAFDLVIVIDSAPLSVNPLISLSGTNDYQGHNWVWQTS